MTGRPKSEQGSERREHRCTVRWTKSERDVIDRAREHLGLAFDVDAIRVLALNGARTLLGEHPENMAQ